MGYSIRTDLRTVIAQPQAYQPHDTLGLLTESRLQRHYVLTAIGANQIHLTFIWKVLIGIGTVHESSSRGSHRAGDDLPAC